LQQNQRLILSSMKMISETSDVWGYGFRVTNAAHETILYKNECEVTDHDGNDVLAAVLPMSRPQDPSGVKSLGFFFKFPLKPGMEPYDILFIDTIDDFLVPLRDTGKDKFWISTESSPIRIGKIILHIPKTFGKIAVTESDDSVGNGRPLSRKELSDFRKHSSIHFTTYGWKCRDVPAPGRFEIEVTKC